MARIFVNAISLGIGGCRTYLDNLVRACLNVSSSHEFHLLGPEDGVAPLAHLAPDRVVVADECRHLRKAGWRRVLCEQLALPVAAHRREVDVLLSVGGIDVLASSALAGVPTVVVVQNSAPWMVPHLLSSRARATYLRVGVKLAGRTASQLIALSQTAKAELCQIVGVDPDRVAVIHHGGASDSFHPDAKLRSDVIRQHGLEEPYLLSVSSIYAFKNYHRLVQAYALVREFDSRAPGLVIVGSAEHKSYSRAVEDLVDSLGLRDSVRFLGHVDYHDLPAVYANARAYIFPSLCESFGLTPLEAMSCGVPVAAAAVSAIPEICGDAAAYFDPFDVEEMARVMLRAASDAPLRRDLTAKGLARARQFSWKATAIQTLQVLERVANG